MREEHPGLIEKVMDEVSQRGPLTARDIEDDEERSRDDWGWNWSAVKLALESHFNSGQITSARRNTQFERAYDLPGRVLPPQIAQRPMLDIDEGYIELVRRAAAALGVASEFCLADYFRTEVTAPVSPSSIWSRPEN